jgi:hypothetical protein
MWAPLAAAGIGAAGSAISAVGQYSSSRSAAAADEQNADLAIQQGQSEASIIRERAGRAAGANRAAIGGSGVDVSGFDDALMDSATNAELDAQTALWNRKTEAANYRSRARQSRSAGAGAIVGGVLGAGAQALSGYGNWKMLKAYNDLPASAIPVGSSGAR